MNNIKVSVIVPVYGVEEYIERCARSLFMQTLVDIEYIFVDDCTRDKSIDVLNRVVLQYPERKHQVTIVHHDVNKGLPKARETGVKIAQGEYIAHCDSDDWVDCTMYEKLYNKAKEDNLDIVYCDFYESNGKTSIPIKHGFIGNPDYLLSHYVNAWIKLSKRDLWQDNRFMFPDSNMGEDRVFTVQLVHLAKSFGYVSEPLYYYYLSPNSMCRKVTKEKAIKNFEERRNNTELICEFYAKNNIKDDRNYLVELKFDTIKWLQPYLQDSVIRKMWINTYPKIFLDVLTCNSINWKAKVAYVIKYLRVKFALVANL